MGQLFPPKQLPVQQIYCVISFKVVPHQPTGLDILTYLALFHLVHLIRPEKEAVFEFKEYDNIESSKHEIAWREWEAACEQTPACLGLLQLNKTKCVRKCMSPSCYTELYAFDELEEGEIDIRAVSFKGCFNQRSGRKRV